MLEFELIDNTEDIIVNIEDDTEEIVVNLTDYDDKEVQEKIEELEQNKVDKISGKGLSTNDYTTEEKNKLAELHNYDDSEIRSSLNNKVDKVSGKGLSTNDYTNEEKTKLASLENYDDTQVRSDISNLQTNKADKSEITNFITKDANNLTYYTLKTNTGSLIDLEINSSTYVVTLKLKDQDGNIISTDSIDLPLETVVVGGRYDSASKKVILTLENGNEIEFSVADLVAGLQTEITSNNKLDSDLVDDTNSGNKFVTTSEKQTWNNKIDSSVLTDYVKFTNIGNSTTPGVYKTGSNFTRYSDGTPYAVTKTYEEYQNDSSGNFVGKGTLENVIAGKNLISTTDYGGQIVGGSVKYGNFGFKINANGVGYIQKASTTNIDTKISDYNCIVPSNLDYAVKSGLTTNTLSMTDTEKEKAKSWIGANFNNTVKGKDLDLTDTTASKIQEIKLYGKSSQEVNTGSNLVQYTDTNTDYFFCNSGVIKFGTYTFVRNNGASLYFPEGAKTYGINTRVLVKKLNLEANKVYTVTVLGGRDAGYGMNIAQYPVDAEDIYARESVIGQGRNFTTTFKTEADKWYMLEMRTPTAGEGGARQIPFTMNIMLNEGAPKKWEAYTNGVATPTMTTPSPITSKTSENLTLTDGVNSQTATLNLENGGIPVSSGGNYTDEDGQQYIADSIERYKDGTGKLIKRVYTQNLPNSFTKSATSGNFLLAIANLDYAPKLPSGQYAVSYDILCNQFTTNETWISQNGYVVVDGTKVTFETAQDFNAYFTEHPLQYEYVLDTPIETDLTEAQLEQLDLSMYNVNTQITSDTNLEIEYIANTKQYIDNSLRELTYNRDKYTLLADTTITEGIVQPITWVSSGDDDMYDDVVVVAENFLGNGSSAFNIGYKLSNSTDFFTTNQSNVLNATTVRNYICETERYLPFKWKCTKRGATNAVADVTHTAIQPMTEWQDKIKEIKVYTSGTGMQFIQGRIRVYGRKRFE